MKFGVCSIVGIGVTVGLCVGASGQNLLINGDFESPVVGSGYVLLPPGSTIPGWTVVGPDGDNVAQVAAGALFNGTQFLDLTGVTGSAGIEQNFATTVGLSYQVSWDAVNGSPVSPGYNYTGPGFTVQATGGPPVTYSVTPSGLPNIIVSLSYTFTATSPVTTLTFMEASGFDSNAGWIDNVSAELIPEPSTFALFGGSGLLALVVWCRCRKA